MSRNCNRYLPEIHERAVRMVGQIRADHGSERGAMSSMAVKIGCTAESPILRDLSFTVNVNNVFDADPPILRRNLPSEGCFTNGFTYGRMVIIGASKKF